LDARSVAPRGATTPGTAGTPAEVVARVSKDSGARGSGPAEPSALSSGQGPNAPSPLGSGQGPGERDVARRPAAAEGTLRLSGIRKRYGDVEAVAGVDLELQAGEFLAILGPSGSGKTTTLRIVGGFVAPDEGRVELSGRDVTYLPPNRRDVNTVFQSYALFPHMTVAANVAYGLKVKRVARAERHKRVAEALALVQLERSRNLRPAELSGGMQQRVALARALINRPRVLLLDEPLGALDRKLRDDMQVELRQVQTELGITFMYVTHDQDEALGMSDRLVVMRDGRIEQSGPPASVYDNPVSLWVAGFVGASNRLTGTVREVGEFTELETDVGPIRARHRHGPIRNGMLATAIVRPEQVKTSTAVPTSPVNAVRVRVQQVLNVGSQLRCVAATPGGVELSARQPRIEGDDSVHPGEDVWMHWSAEGVHVYAPDKEGSSASQTDEHQLSITE
jgi:ABC-type Fe3+/spermidine/putrescine transport system ATPase subunit